MRKSHYNKELEYPGALNIKYGRKNKDVKKLQEWLMLYHLTTPEFKYNITVDGHFGPQTLEVLKQYQSARGLMPTGFCGMDTWKYLTQPLYLSFTDGFGAGSGRSLREMIVSVAIRHLNHGAREIIPNKGPWVRSYMDGNDGRQWAWCVGAYQSFVDQACSMFSIDFTESIMPLTYSCDIMGQHGLQNNLLIRNKDIESNLCKIKPGDAGLIRKSTYDWVHIFLITKVDGDQFHTIEGNSNDEGHRDGYELCRRIRTWKNSNIDVFQLLA